MNDLSVGKLKRIIRRKKATLKRLKVALVTFMDFRIYLADPSWRIINDRISLIKAELEQAEVLLQLKKEELNLKDIGWVKHPTYLKDKVNIYRRLLNLKQQK